jgi:hypothetical protein
MIQKSPWKSLVYVVSAYAAVVFVTSLLIEPTFGVAFIFAYAVFYPIVMLSGAWAVLGPGSYVARTLTSVGAVLVIFFAGMFAVLLTSLPRRPFFDMEMSLWELLIVIGCFGIPLIVAAQVPYWLGRFIFGWQLIAESDTPKAKRLDIKEMLGITAVIAVVLVAPSQAVSILTQNFVQQIVEIGDTEIETQTDPNTGETTFEEVVVDSRNIAKFQAERSASIAEGQRFGFGFVLGYAIVIAITTLINLPCFYLGMMVDKKGDAFSWAMFYWFGICFVLFVGVTVMTQPPGNVLAPMIIYFIFLSLIFAAAASLPMYVARFNGAKLIGRSDFRNAIPSEPTEKPAEVTDPFGD